jgi:hypothetical protein
VNNGEILQDFRRRYENTYIKLCAEQKGIEAVGWLQRVRGDDDKFATLEIKTAEFGVIQTNFGSEEYQIKFEYPPMGCFQHGPDSLVFRRRPERQYTRGLCSGNSNLAACHSTLTGVGVSFTLERVRAAFHHKVYDIKQALAGMKSGNFRSVALANNFSISLPMHKDKDLFFVWHWGSLVGACDSRGQLVKVYEPVYEKPMREVLNG